MELTYGGPISLPNAYCQNEIDSLRKNRRIPMRFSL